MAYQPTSPAQSIAVLPRAPVNGSPVPGLTSLYHKSWAGNYGNRGYPGNCSGELIKDLLRYFRPKNVLDPMTGSGTCLDVCRELKLPCRSGDIRAGADACDPKTFAGLGTFDFVWVHPPNRRPHYHRVQWWAIHPRAPDNCRAGVVGSGRVAGTPPGDRFTRADAMRVEPTRVPPRARGPSR